MNEPTTPTSMPRAAIYCRAATEPHGEQPDPLAARQERCRRHCTERGRSVISVYGEIGSGLDGDRPALAELRQAIAAGEIDMIVAASADRLSRDRDALSALVLEIDTAGATLDLCDGSAGFWQVHR
jgi:DNA invertase Pin-like site-specific DNA recombinase